LKLGVQNVVCHSVRVLMFSRITNLVHEGINIVAAYFLTLFLCVERQSVHTEIKGKKMIRC